MRNFPEKGQKWESYPLPKMRPRLSHFATRHGRITHYSPIVTALFIQPDTQDNRVVPEPGTVGKAVTIHLVDSGQTGLQKSCRRALSGACDAKTNVVVLVGRVVVVPVRRRQVVGVVVPIAPANAASRRTKPALLPSLLHSMNSIQHDVIQRFGHGPYGRSMP